jgi:hypothetical protein
MAKSIKKRQLHVTYPDAQRVRSRLLNNDLTEKDKDTLLQILSDVYPASQRRPQSHRQRRAYQRQRHRQPQ